MSKRARRQSDATRAPKKPWGPIGIDHSESVLAILELRVHIWQHVALGTLLRCMRVCQQWNTHVRDSIESLPCLCRIVKLFSREAPSNTLVHMMAFLANMAPQRALLVSEPMLPALLECARGTSDRQGGFSAETRGLPVRADEVIMLDQASRLFAHHGTNLCSITVPVLPEWPQWTRFIARELGRLAPRATSVTLDPCIMPVDMNIIPACIEQNLVDEFYRNTPSDIENIVKMYVSDWLGQMHFPLHMERLHLARFEFVFPDTPLLVGTMSHAVFRQHLHTAFYRQFTHALDRCAALVHLELDDCHPTRRIHWRGAVVGGGGRRMVPWNVAHLRYPLFLLHGDVQPSILHIAPLTLARLTTLVLRDTVFDVAAFLAMLLESRSAAHLTALVLETTAFDDGGLFEDGMVNQPRNVYRTFMASWVARFDALAAQKLTLPCLERLSLTMRFGESGFRVLRNVLSMLPVLADLTVTALDNDPVTCALIMYDADWLDAHALPAERIETLQRLEWNVAMRADRATARYDAIHLLSHFPALREARLLLEMDMDELVYRTHNERVGATMSPHDANSLYIRSGSTMTIDLSFPDTTRTFMCQMAHDNLTDVCNTLIDLQLSGEGCRTLNRLTLAIRQHIAVSYYSGQYRRADTECSEVAKHATAAIRSGFAWAFDAHRQRHGMLVSPSANSSRSGPAIQLAVQCHFQCTSIIPNNPYLRPLAFVDQTAVPDQRHVFHLALEHTDSPLALQRMEIISGRHSNMERDM